MKEFQAHAFKDSSAACLNIHLPFVSSHVPVKAVDFGISSKVACNLASVVTAVLSQLFPVLFNIPSFLFMLDKDSPRLRKFVTEYLDRQFLQIAVFA